MSIQLDDFCGFQFNGVHSSELNILRVSNGSRYDDDLVPAFQDHTAQIEGGDGTLFWESFYSQKPINIQIAFDNLSEEGYRRLRQVFNGKAKGEFIFDEAPYKAYSVKVQSPPQLHTICFDQLDDNNNTVRVYKGEGSIPFVAYYPYAKSIHKYLDEFNEDYTNKSEWATASGMLSTKGNYDDTSGEGKRIITLYNAGDIETDWQAFYPLTDAGCALERIYLTNEQNQTEGEMVFDPISKKGEDVYIRINSRTNLIEGCDSNKNPTGTLYNEFLKAGDFFKIPLGQHTFTANEGALCKEIRYNYLYY